MNEWGGEEDRRLGGKTNSFPESDLLPEENFALSDLLLPPPVHVRLAEGIRDCCVRREAALDGTDNTLGGGDPAGDGWGTTPLIGETLTDEGFFRLSLLPRFSKLSLGIELGPRGLIT